MSMSHNDTSGPKTIWNNIVTVDDWRNVWKIEKTAWNLPYPHPKFVQFLDTVTNGQKELKWLFPLCGKAVDMKWMYDEGHTVVGIEAASIACEEFFLENNISYTTQELEEVKGTLYKSEDGRLRLYCCDVFNFSFTTEKDFDAIFDRGGLTSMSNSTERRRYTEIIMSVMHPECRILLLTFGYDEALHIGPPFVVPLDDIPELYGSENNVQLLSIEEIQFDTVWVGDVDERAHLITLKHKN